MRQDLPVSRFAAKPGRVPPPQVLGVVLASAARVRRRRRRVVPKPRAESCSMNALCEANTSRCRAYELGQHV